MNLSRGALNLEMKAMQQENYKPPEKAVFLTDGDLLKIFSSPWCDASTAEDLNHRLYVLISIQLGCRISRIMS